jgi:hypothetical protein
MANGNVRAEKEVPAKVYTIDAENNIGAHTGQEVPAGATSFASAGDLEAISTAWPAKRLMEIWNRLPNMTPVSKFTDRKTAVRRIWQALNLPELPGAQPHEHAAKTASRKTGKAKGPAKAQAGETKTERIIALLKRPEGATLKAIMTATGWQAHSVRGFISAQLTKRMGLKVKSFKRAGERVYRIRN